MIHWNISKIRYFNKIKFYKLVSTLLILFSIFFFVHTAIKYFPLTNEFNFDIYTLSIFIISIFLVVVNSLLGAIIWKLLLEDYGEKKSFLKILKIFLTAQIGKYLPGNVGQNVGRVVMAKEAGLSIAPVLITLIVEILWNISIGIGLALISIIIATENQFFGKSLHIGPKSFFLIALFLMTAPWIGVGLINRWLPGIAHRLSGQKKLVGPRPKTAFIVACLYILSFLIMGIILSLQAKYFFNSNEVGLIKTTCLFAAAWLGGYLMPGAPAGLGVRESLMLLLFTPLFGPEVAVGLGITLRITTTIGDFVAFLWGFFLKNFGKC